MKRFVSSLLLMVLGIFGFVAGLTVRATAGTVSLEGTLTDSSSSAHPVVGACVDVYNVATGAIVGSDVSDNSGHYNVQVDDAGDYKVRVYDGKDAGCNASKRVGSDVFASRYFGGPASGSSTGAAVINAGSGFSGNDMFLGPGRRIFGHVDDKDGEDLRNVDVTVLGASGHTFTHETNKDGDYEVSGLAYNTKHKVTFSKDGYVTENYNDKTGATFDPVNTSISDQRVDATLGTGSSGGGSSVTGVVFETLTSGGTATTSFAQGQSGQATFSGLKANTHYELGVVASPFVKIADGTSKSDGTLTLTFTLPKDTKLGDARLVLRSDDGTEQTSKGIKVLAAGARGGSQLPESGAGIAIMTMSALTFALGGAHMVLWATNPRRRQAS